MIPLLDRHFARRLAGTYFRTLLVLVALFVFVDLMTRRRNQILELNVPLGTVAEYYLCYIPGILNEFQIASLAMLVSVLMVYGGAAQRHEITSMLAAGVGLRRIARVPLAAGLLVTGLLFGMTETIGVEASRRSAELEERYFMRIDKADRRTVSWANLEGDWSVHIMKFNRKAFTGENVLMLAFRDDVEEQIRARRIYWDQDAGNWVVEDGIRSKFHLDGERPEEHVRIRQAVAPIREDPGALFAADRPSAAQTIAQLSATAAIAKGRGMAVDSLNVDWHGKFAKPALCFVMVLIAIPFAMRLRSGGLGVGLGISIALGLAYLMVFAIAQALGYIGRIEPFAAAWFANAAFAIAGVVLFARTPT